MPDQPTPPSTPPPPKHKRRMWLFAIVAFVLIAIAAGGGFLAANHGTISHSPPRPRLTKEPGYYALNPPLVANFTDARAIHFLQVGITLESHDPAALKAAGADTPEIRNALLLLFSSQSYETLSTTQGKLALQVEALAKVQAIVRQSIGRPGIQSLYFTSFVMQ